MGTQWIVNATGNYSTRIKYECFFLIEINFFLIGNKWPLRVISIFF